MKVYIGPEQYRIEYFKPRGKLGLGWSSGSSISCRLVSIFSIKRYWRNPYSEKLDNVRVTQSVHHFALGNEFLHVTVGRILGQPLGVYFRQEPVDFFAVHKAPAIATSSTVSYEPEPSVFSVSVTP